MENKKKTDLGTKIKKLKSRAKRDYKIVKSEFIKAYKSLGKKKKKKVETTTTESKPLFKKPVLKKMVKEKTAKNIEPQEKIVKGKKKKGPVFVMAVVVWVIIGLGIVGLTGGLIVANKMCEDIPEFNAKDLGSTNSSVIYDAQGNVISELGTYVRQNVSYEEMPNSLIDAFIAIEDSRYFEHFGFDIPRFSAAIIDVVRTRSFSQGGSTITMQLIKNSYFQVDNGDDSQMAARSGLAGVKRKVQEIVLAVKADKEVGKKPILALYLNKVNFGGNIRGVEKASQYYFGKHVSEINVSEAAFLAGIINAPNGNNPYNNLYKGQGNAYISDSVDYLANGTKRRNEVLNLMAYHGFLTDEEVAIAKNVKLEDCLLQDSDRFTTSASSYQSYIDVVIEEAEKATGHDPYTYPMKIYTCMNQTIQNDVDAIQNGETDLKYTNDKLQGAIVVLNNQTGEIIALSGGRNQTGVRQFNRATDSRIQPGSAIKPIYEYALAVDRLGWATSHCYTDKPIFYEGTNILISNAGSQGYHGDLLMDEAVARSLNTPAVQTLTAVRDVIGKEACVEYLKSIGINVSSFDDQHAIGGSDLIVSPVALGAGHAMLMNEGYYITPHTIEHIEYFDESEEEYVADTTGNQVISAAAAYIIASLEEYNVSGPYINYMQILKSNYPVYAKTGTTDWGTISDPALKVPSGSRKDSWLVAQTSNYTITVWNGFDKLDVGSYMTSNDSAYNLKGKIAKRLIDLLNNELKYGPKGLTRPKDVLDISHIRGAFPYCLPQEGYEIATGLIKADSQYARMISLEQLQRQVITGTTKHISAKIDDQNFASIIVYGYGPFGDGTKDVSNQIVYYEDGVKKAIDVWVSARSYFPMELYITPDFYFVEITGEGFLPITTVSTVPKFTGISFTDEEGNIIRPETINIRFWTSKDSIDSESIYLENVQFNEPSYNAYDVVE